MSVRKDMKKALGESSSPAAGVEIEVLLVADQTEPSVRFRRDNVTQRRKPGTQAGNKSQPKSRNEPVLSSPSSIYHTPSSTPEPLREQPGTKAKATGAAKRKQTSGKARGDAGVLREIHRMQRQTTTTISKAAFARLVREIMQPMSQEVNRLTPLALDGMLEATELYITILFSDASMITLNRGQATLQSRDIQLLMFLRGPSG